MYVAACGLFHISFIPFVCFVLQFSGESAGVVVEKAGNRGGKGQPSKEGSQVVAAESDDPMPLFLAQARDFQFSV